MKAEPGCKQPISKTHSERFAFFKSEVHLSKRQLVDVSEPVGNPAFSNLVDIIN